MSMKYVLVKAKTVAELEDQVQTMCNHGYILAGNLVNRVLTTSTTVRQGEVLWVQPMVLNW